MIMEQYINIFVDKSYPDFIDKYLTTKTLTRLKYVTPEFCSCFNKKTSFFLVFIRADDNF